MKGGVPVFGYPLISFRDSYDEEPAHNVLWRVISKSMMKEAESE